MRPRCRRALAASVLVCLAGLTLACGGDPTKVVFVTGLVVTPPDAAIHQGQSVRLRASLVDTSGLPVVEVAATFVTFDPSIASVSREGIVTSRGPVGTVALEATYGNFEAYARVRVVDSSIAASFPLSARPFGLAVSAAGVVYVTRVDAAALARIDLPSTRLSGSVDVGLVPTNVAFDLPGTTAYVTNQFSQNVGVVAVATNTQTSAIPVLGDPGILRVSPDGSLLWVSTNVDSLYAISLSTSAVVHRFGFPWMANGLAFHPTNDSLLYASVIDGAVREINFKRDSVRRTFVLGGKPQGIAVAPNASELYVANEHLQALQVVSLSTGAITQTVALGGTPFDLHLSPDGTRIWVSVMSAGQVKVLDRTSRTVVRTITTLGTPRRFGFHPSGAPVVVANEAGWVDFIR